MEYVHYYTDKNMKLDGSIGYGMKIDLVAGQVNA